MTSRQVLDAWDQVEGAAECLFDLGLVHTDIHEHNICFRGNQVVLIDFEDARRLRQDLPFLNSLDMVGANKYGKVGDFPDVKGRIKGLTCLNRLRHVFESALRKQHLPKLLAKCKFDNECPFNKDLLQKPDNRLYQSLDFPGLRKSGQRPMYDCRQAMFTYLMRRWACRIPRIRHLDIGSNLGVFCLRAADLSFVERSTGVEAYADYVNVAQALAFIFWRPKARFLNAICGEVDLAGLAGPADAITMLSVYHHIPNKKRFLDSIKSIGATFFLGEFATQERYYPERGSVAAELEYIQKRTGYGTKQVLATTPDYGRPVVLFSHRKMSGLDKLICRVLCSRRGDRLGGYVRRMRHSFSLPIGIVFGKRKDEECHLLTASDEDPHGLAGFRSKTVAQTWSRWSRRVANPLRTVKNGISQLRCRLGL